MKVNLIEIRKRVEKCLISEKRHPTADLLIFNYTPACQFDNIWDHYTRMCRGLITDTKGNIVARPFPKFFNIGDERNGCGLKDLPAEIPVVTEKLDGSLGILYNDGEKNRISTRGSFESDQALWATKWLNNNKSDVRFLKGYTYLFEIIFPENKIIVNYGDKKDLVLLAVINNETGAELSMDIIKTYGFTIPKIYNKNTNELIEIAKTLDANNEGFVARYLNGLRVKIKGDEYKRLHKLLTGVSAKSIWEMMRDGVSLEPVIKDVPDEFYNWVKNIQTNLQVEFNKLKNDCKKIVAEAEKIDNRKEQASLILEHDKKLSGACFSLLDGKSERADYLIWKILKPVNNIFVCGK